MNEYDDDDEEEYFYDSNEYDYAIQEPGANDEYTDEEEFPITDIEGDATLTEGDLIEYDIDPRHLMPHWDRHNFVYTRDAANPSTKN